MVAGVIALDVLLCIGFFPLFFDRVAIYDDEGYALVAVRQFLSRGSLYVHTSFGYGPFYVSFVSGIFRLTGLDPTPFDGRMIVMALTALSAGVFAAAAWRHVTRSWTALVLCEISTFLVLVSVAGHEPMHPGSLVVLLVAILCYALRAARPSRATHVSWSPASQWARS